VKLDAVEGGEQNAGRGDLNAPKILARIQVERGVLESFVNDLLRRGLPRRSARAVDAK